MCSKKCARPWTSGGSSIWPQPTVMAAADMRESMSEIKRQISPLRNLMSRCGRPSISGTTGGVRTDAIIGTWELESRTCQLHQRTRRLFTAIAGGNGSDGGGSAEKDRTSGATQTRPCKPENRTGSRSYACSGPSGQCLGPEIWLFGFRNGTRSGLIRGSDMPSFDGTSWK